MKKIKLSDYKLKKGILKSPWSEIFNVLDENESWFYGRLPEYLWIGLIIEHYGRSKSLKILINFMKFIASNIPSITTPAWSIIIAQNDENRNLFFEKLFSIIDKNILMPLTLLQFDDNFISFIKYYDSFASFESRFETIQLMLGKLCNHQSEDSTDIRYIVLSYAIFSGKLNVQRSQIEQLEKYHKLNHTDEEMRMIRPMIRATELIIIGNISIIDNFEYLEYFWDCVGKNTNCDCFYIVQKEGEKVDYNTYLSEITNKLKYYTELIKIDTNDEKLFVLTSISVFCLKRFKELIEHNLFNAISGRSILRGLIENYIIMEYLILAENEHSNIWRDYQLYGIGNLNLIIKRNDEQENGYKSKNINFNYLSLLVNEFIDEQFIDIDLNYFNKDNIRTKSEKTNNKDLYNIFDYCSNYEHSLWGAIRESTLLKCNNPAHRYHTLPDIDDLQQCSDVWGDCLFIMNKILELLKKEFGYKR